MKVVRPTLRFLRYLPVILAIDLHLPGLPTQGTQGTIEGMVNTFEIRIVGGIDANVTSVSLQELHSQHNSRSP